MSGGFDALGARYFDGDRPLGQEVSLDLTEGTLQIGLDDGENILWPVVEVRRLADMAGDSPLLAARSRAAGDI